MINDYKKTMKHKLLYGALCASVVFLGSCNDEDIIKYAHQEGDAIVFGARAGFENGNGGTTRTTYSGTYYDDAGGKTYERIDWVQGVDMLQIYCAEVSAPADKTVDYVVSGTVSSDETKSYSTLTEGANEVGGLNWGDPATVHTFYGLYPSPEMLPDDAETTLKQGIKMNGTVANGVVPVSQAGTVPASPTDNVYVVAPDMTYAYMVAKSVVDPSVTDAVNMTFYPIVTAVELTLTLPDLSSSLTESIQLEEVYLKSTQPITGDFECDLDTWTPGGAFTVTKPAGGVQGYTLNLPVWKKSGSTYVPLTLNKGQSVRVTAFLLPGADITNLTVGFQTPTGIADKELVDIEIKANTKYLIRGLNLPIESINYSKWMSHLPGDMLLKDLSIPGTGATFSYNYNSSNADFYKAQELNFEAQWNAGIRAFEIISDRQLTGEESLGSLQAQCNGVNMGVTVKSVFENLLNKLKPTTDGPCTETAVVMLTYQPTGVRGRAPEIYMKNLVSLYNELKAVYGADAFITYNSGLTLDAVRGKLMILMRATQHIEDDPHYFDDVLTGTPIMEIDGCGTAKDKWGCRGYEVKVNNGVGDWKTALDIQPSGLNGYEANDKTDNDGVAGWDYPVIENYMYAEATTDYSDLNNVPWPTWNNDYIRKGDMHFVYESNVTDSYTGNRVDVWCQEWQRVVPTGGVMVKLGRCAGWFSSSPHYFYVYWHESYAEKVENIKKTFDMAISGSYPQYLFINSLCGYYVTTASPNSCVPYADDPCTTANHYWNPTTTIWGTAAWPIGGMEGDIAGLAKDLNNMLYNHILGKSDADFTGPTGLVYMNRVSNTLTTGDEGSYYLPGVIIANNFKHN